MPKIDIQYPGNGATVSPKFTVSGRSDADTGAQVSCTISKESFSQTANGVVDAMRRWSVTLGAQTPIPVGTGYVISASHGGGGSDGVSNITVEVPPQPDHGTSTPGTNR
jgi:pantoate kinase